MTAHFALKGLAPIVVATLLFAAPSAAGDKPKNPPPQTFLDTINKGKEVGITNADFGVPNPPVAPAAVQSAPVPVAPAAPAETTVATSKIEPKAEAGVVPSRFKIQILASSMQDQVKREKGVLGAKSDLPLLISFEAPYYRLFAGDFSQRSDAESSLAKLKALGYNDAWIVRTAAQKK